MGGRPASHWGVWGVTQSGKTLWLSRRLRDQPRWIVLDADYDRDPYGDLPHVRTATGVRELADEARRRAKERPERWRVSYRAESPEEYLAGVRVLWALHRRLELRTTLVVVEEAHRLLTGQKLPGVMREVLFRGLKRRLVLVTVSQNVQQVPSQIRLNTDRHVVFRQVGRLPRDLAQLLGDQADDLPRLEPLKPAYEARQGVHYVGHPEHLDLEAQWRQIGR